MRLIRMILLAGLFLSLLATPSAAEHFEPGAAVWPDRSGTHIDAHGGGVLLHEGVYYWYGEQRGGDRAGVRCYSSKDLYNWNYEGLILEASDDDALDIRVGCIIERPKVVHNAKTGKFVLWFHLELKDIGYIAARTAVAVGDSPTGPFTYVRSFRPNPGRLPMGMTGGLDKLKRQIKAAAPNGHMQKIAGEILLRDLGPGQMARDMTLFVDDDAVAYHVYSSEDNSTLHVAELTDDYLNFTGKFARVFPGGEYEAPAIFKHAGKYYLIASGCMGWNPTQARSAVADSIFGPWKALGDPCTGGPNPHTGIGPELTFGGQSTFVFPVPGSPEKFIAMFDVWQPADLKQSRYVWLPLTFEDGKPVIRWHDAWNLRKQS